MKKTFFYYCFSVLFVTSIFSSCVDELNLSEVDGSVLIDQALGIPIADINLTMGNLVDFLDTNKEVIYSGDSIIFEEVDSAEFQFRAVDLTEYSEWSQKTVSLNPSGSAVTVPSNTYIPGIDVDTISLGLNLDTPNQRVDSARVTNAVLSFKIETDLPLNPSDVEVKFAFIDKRVIFHDRDANMIAADTLKIIPTSFGTVLEVPLNDLFINTSGDATGLPFTIKVKAKTGANPVTVSTSSYVRVHTKFTQMDFSVAYGFFNPDTRIATKLFTSELNLAEYLPGASLKFANPKIYITASSNIGTYIKFNVDYIEAFYDKDSANTSVKAVFNGQNSVSIPLKKKPLSHLAPNNWISVQLPRLDKDFGSTDKLYMNENKPNRLNYKFSAQKDENYTSSTDFVTPEAKVKVVMRSQSAIDLHPGSYYQLTDTILNIGTLISDIVGETFDDENNDADVQLRLLFKNGLPLQVDSFEMKFLDANGAEMAISVKKKYALDLPLTINSEGLVQLPIKPQLITILLNRTMIQELKTVKDMVILVPVTTGAGKRMQITKSNTFGVKVGLFVKGKSKTSLW